MNCGVSKSGSPAPMAITSLPSALSLAALADTARVGDALMACRRWATSDIAGVSGGAEATCFGPILPCKISGLPAWTAALDGRHHLSRKPFSPAPVVRPGRRPAAGDRQAG